jgi:hypothetical protein
LPNFGKSSTINHKAKSAKISSFETLKHPQLKLITTNHVSNAAYLDENENLLKQKVAQMLQFI